MSHLCLRIPLRETDRDVGGDETRPAGEQYALGLVLALRLDLAFGQGAGDAVGDHRDGFHGCWSGCRWMLQTRRPFCSPEARSSKMERGFLKELMLPV